MILLSSTAEYRVLLQNFEKFQRRVSLQSFTAEFDSRNWQPLRFYECLCAKFEIVYFHKFLCAKGSSILKLIVDIVSIWNVWKRSEDCYRAEWTWFGKKKFLFFFSIEDASSLSSPSGDNNSCFFVIVCDFFFIFFEFFRLKIIEFKQFQPTILSSYGKTIIEITRTL